MPPILAPVWRSGDARPTIEEWNDGSPSWSGGWQPVMPAGSTSSTS